MITIISMRLRLTASMQTCLIVFDGGNLSRLMIIIIDCVIKSGKSISAVIKKIMNVRAQSSTLEINHSIDVNHIMWPCVGIVTVDWMSTDNIEWWTMIALWSNNYTIACRNFTVVQLFNCIILFQCQFVKCWFFENLPKLSQKLCLDKIEFDEKSFLF